MTVDGQTVQVAHEALIREWPRLRAWLDDDRDGRRLHRHLTHAAHDWEALGREPSELYRGSRLATTSEWLERDDHAGELNPLEREFVRACAEAADAERAAVVEQVQARERSNLMLRRLLAAAAIMLVVALLAGVLAFVQRDRANDEADASRAASKTADVSRLVAQSGAVRTENAHVAALLALEANRMHDDAETEGALFSAVIADPRRISTLPTGTSEGVWSMPGGSSVLVLSHGRLGVWSIDRRRRTVRVPVTGVQTAAVRNDGMIAAARSDGTVRFFTADGKVDGPEIRSGLRGLLATAAFSPDGRSLVVAYGNWAHPNPIDPDRTVRLYNVADRTRGPKLAGPLAEVTGLAFSPDGRTLALGDADDEVALRETESGAVAGAPIAASAPVVGIAFDPRATGWRSAPWCRSSR